MKSAVVLGAISLGFALLLMSGLWSTLFPATSTWTTEKAERWSEVKHRLHNLSFVVHAPPGRTKMYGGPDPAQAKQEYDQLDKEEKVLSAEFQSAYDRPNTIATFLKWTGITLAGLGILGWLAVRES